MGPHAQDGCWIERLETSFDVSVLAYPTKMTCPLSCPWALTSVKLGSYPRWSLGAHSVLSICASELAYPFFVPVEGWHFGIWRRHIWELWTRAWSGYLGTCMDPPKLSSSRQLWSQRLKSAGLARALLALGPRADYTSNVGCLLGRYRTCLTLGLLPSRCSEGGSTVFQPMLTGSCSLS